MVHRAREKGEGEGWRLRFFLRRKKRRKGEKGGKGGRGGAYLSEVSARGGKKKKEKAFFNFHPGGRG